MRTLVVLLLLALLAHEAFSFRLPLKAKKTRTLTTSMGRLLEKRGIVAKGTSYHIPLKVR